MTDTAPFNLKAFHEQRKAREERVYFDLTASDLLAAYELGERDFACAKLQGAKLQDANLQGAKLQGAYLQWANLQGAKLQGANLQGAKLKDANLQGAKLQWAQLQGAQLQWAQLQWANLQDANLQDANLQGANLQGANLQDANLQDTCILAASMQISYGDNQTCVAQLIKTGVIEDDFVVLCGCRQCSMAEFVEAVRIEHADGLPRRAAYEQIITIFQAVIASYQGEKVSST